MAGKRTYTFKGDKATMEQVFGSKPLQMTQLSSKLWAHIKTWQVEQDKSWTPKVNDKVKAKWTDGSFYAGKIVKINGNGNGSGKKYHIVFEDGDKGKVARNEMFRG